ncbi:hypothetical protein [Actinomadura rugatobispora]|uniref:Uncharacterized protein n=1 Tax=Actinomadura rugatobispora TaxID=1994 RepID=A0ABW1A772_9ACTN|nr:hypothetical protein GCM10010200_018280 [Actinomadura rugatobispora]
MPGRTDAITAHARVLGADAEVLEECAARLRRLASRLGAHDAAPPWLYRTLDDHITACVVASADLADASARLDDYAGATTDGTT